MERHVEDMDADELAAYEVVPVVVNEHIQHTDLKSRVVVIFADRPPVTKVIDDPAIAERVAEFAAKRSSAVFVHLVKPAEITGQAFMIDDRVE